MEYVAKRRVSYAQQLLINGVPAVRAGEAAGFADYTTFYRTYKKLMGHSPISDRHHMDMKPMEPLYLDVSRDVSPRSTRARHDNIWEEMESTQASSVDIGTLRDPGWKDRAGGRTSPSRSSQT